MRHVGWGAFAAGLALVAACSASGGHAPRPPVELGGAATSDDPEPASFAVPAPTLDEGEREVFVTGNERFEQSWVVAPSAMTERDGLGPVYNDRSCASCHVLDGRGMPPASGDSAARGLLLRLSIPGAVAHGGPPLPDPVYGDQLQDQAITGVPAEGRIAVDYEPVAGTYGDGTAYELRRPSYTIVDPGYGPLADDVMISPRLAPQIIGLGLLEAVPEATILAAADPGDADGDGISGRANHVWDASTGAAVLGRFGWKATQPSVATQVAAAFADDLGLTSTPRPESTCTSVQAKCAAAADGGDPEVSDADLGAVTFYSRTVAVPAMRDADDSGVRDGAELFDDLGCASCHTPTLSTGPSDVAALAHQTFHPYTDLLLHDMGAGLADGRPDHGASGAEWRTPPLWGLGLVDEVNGHRFLLHDGRARTFAEAILWHGGEGAAAADAFRVLPESDRAALVAFLEAL